MSGIDWSSVRNPVVAAPLGDTSQLDGLSSTCGCGPPSCGEGAKAGFFSSDGMSALAARELGRSGATEFPMPGAPPPLIGPGAEAPARLLDTVHSVLSPTFDGRPFTRQAARLLAKCEGDTWVASGPLPNAYERFARASEEWGAVVAYDSGRVYLIVGDRWIVGGKYRFSLYILTDDPAVAALEDSETYCGYSILTKVSGVMKVSSECCEGGAYVCIRLEIKLKVERALAYGGELVTVSRGSAYDEAFVPNQGGVQEIEHYLWTQTMSGLFSDGVHLHFTVRSCEVMGGSVITVAKILISTIWSSAEAALADSSVAYLGPESCDVVHALYLLRNSKVWDAGAEWLEDLCARRPIDCEAPEDDGPDDDEREDLEA